MPWIFSKIYFLLSFIFPLIMCLRYFQKYIFAKIYFFLLVDPSNVGSIMYFDLIMGHFQTCFKIINFELLGVSKYEEISSKMREKIFPNRNFQLWEDARADICPSFCGFYSSSFYSPHLSTHETFLENVQRKKQKSAPCLILLQIVNLFRHFMCRDIANSVSEF